MATLAHPYKLGKVTWDELAAEYDELAAQHPELEAVRDIVASIASSAVRDQLVGGTSMSDVLVAPADAVVPLDVLRIAAVDVDGEAGVRIEHRSDTGRNDDITRGRDNAVGLFWRFVEYKWGITQP